MMGTQHICRYYKVFFSFSKSLAIQNMKCEQLISNVLNTYKANIQNSIIKSIYNPKTFQHMFHTCTLNLSKQNTVNTRYSF